MFAVPAAPHTFVVSPLIAVARGSHRPGMPAEHFKHASEALSALNRRLVEAVLSPPRGGGPEIAAMFASLAAGLARDPERWVEIQKRYLVLS